MFVQLEPTFRLARYSADTGMRLLMKVVCVDVINVAVTLAAVGQRAF